MMQRSFFSFEETPTATHLQSPSSRSSRRKKPSSSMTAAPPSPALLVIDVSSGDSEENSERSEKREEDSDWMIGRSKRQRFGGRVLPPGFLDPLPHQEPSKDPNLLGEVKKLVHAHWDDTRIQHLIMLLKDYNKPQWKRKKKFMKGALERITEDFNNSFPDTNMSKLQIKCQLHRMKEKYRDLKKLLELREFEWDFTNNVVQGPEDAWEKLLYTNKDAKRWYKKPWPYYSILKEIFEENCAPENHSGDLKDHEVRGVELRFDSNQVAEEVDESHIISSSSPVPHQPSPLPQTPLPAKKQQPSQAPSSTSSTRAKSTRGQKTDAYIRGPEREIPKNEGDFSIKTCLKAFYRLDGFAKEEIVKVGKVFKRKENREIFISLRDEDKEFWLRGEVDNL
ncbi:hypothetical protein AXF42_Ash006684 [Apostasia shenzhenica]|uniref:Myb/SANT-like domain-containing protein n=1 Tax=Apostasia shenzhenica TaxID=1088818 RepID=A0A2I0AIT8_9ASPA|nr:hypothetical protein AXF42_Ash006684 [Apostasia shenzhenica]